MAKDSVNTRTILIESILGGHSPTTHLSRPDQFRNSVSIDPSLPADNADTRFTTVASGLIRPVGVQGVSGIPSTSIVRWIIPEPKTDAFGGPSHYVYLDSGSIYSTNLGLSATNALSDGGAMSGSNGNGAAYYDNYVYFARDTTIARYGPLNGTPDLDGNYWNTTLAKTALSDVQYPYDPWVGLQYANHVMHRHSDGRLYIADVVNNQGVLHYISTTKTTVEGDTDNGSTYQALTFGYGLYPVAIESYGNGLAIALLETSYRTDHPSAQTYPVMKAKIAFWDTISQNFNSIIWVEFPDALITAMRNVNGVLYFSSGSTDDTGFRITRYVGGSSFEDVYYSDMGFSPHQSATLGKGGQFIFGSNNTVIDATGAGSSVWSLGLKNKLSTGLFNIARTSVDSNGVTALAHNEAALNFNQQSLLIGYDGGLDLSFQSLLSTASPPIWWSQTYRIGQPFKITKIRIPTLETSTNGTPEITPKLYFDNGARYYSLPEMGYSDKRNFVFKPTSAIGENDFFLELKWTGNGSWTVSLPITIEYELIDD